MSTHEPTKANKTDAGNGSNGICRVSNVLRSPSPDPSRSGNQSNTLIRMKYQEWQLVWKSGLFHAEACIERLEFGRKDLGGAESVLTIVGAVATLLHLCHHRAEGEALFEGAPDAAAAFVQLAKKIDSHLGSRPDLQALEFGVQVHEDYRLLGLVVSVFLHRAQLQS